jgi:hypothetical protein
LGRYLHAGLIKRVSSSRRSKLTGIYWISPQSGFGIPPCKRAVLPSGYLLQGWNPSCPSCVLDVMLQTHSSPAAEGRSPPLLRCTTLKKAVTFCALQFAWHSRSYMRYFEVVCGALISSRQALLLVPSPSGCTRYLFEVLRGSSGEVLLIRATSLPLANEMNRFWGILRSQLKGCVPGTQCPSSNPPAIVPLLKSTAFNKWVFFSPRTWV